MRMRTPSDLPALRADGWVTAESLKAGHIQKSAGDGTVTIFWEDGRYYVTNAQVSVPSFSQHRKNEGTVETVTYATVEAKSLYHAHRIFLFNAWKYNYRVTSEILPAEAIAAPESQSWSVEQVVSRLHSVG